jgi:transcriptional regulator with XRE-family HTH domain
LEAEGRDAVTMPTVEIAAELGRRLRSRRALLGRTIASVALEAGLSVPYVANLENGRGNPTLSALHRLAGALGVPLRDLLDLDADTGGEPDATALPASLRRFSRLPRFREDTRWLAEEMGADPDAVRALLLRAMAAVPEPPGRQLSELDWHRLLDALLLVLRRH